MTHATKVLVLFVSVFLFSFSSQADQVMELTIPNQGTSYFVMYSQQGQWFVEEFFEPEGQLQDKVQSHSFNNEEKAQTFFNSKTQNHSPRMNMMSDQSESVGVMTNTPGTIWQVTQAWDQQWEQKYAEWFEAEMHPDFFRDYNIKTDCADAAYAARWIFARMHGLPAGVTLAGSDKLMTQATMKRRWANQPTHENWWQDIRFLEALDYLTGNSYTHTLNLDSYPTRITRETYLPGSMYLYLRDRSGHTYQFRQYRGQSLELVSSTVPKAIRTLRVSYYNADRPQPELRGGLIRHRWVYQDSLGRWKMLSRSSMPDYSLEQFQPEFMSGYNSFDDAVIAALNGGAAIDQRGRLNAAILNLKDYIPERVALVNDGYAFCQQADCSEGTANHDSWSTPSRDRRIKGYFDRVHELIEISDQINGADIWISAKSNFNLEVIPGVSLNLQQLEEIWYGQTYSSQPWEHPTLRWGVPGKDDLTFEVGSPYENNMRVSASFYIEDKTKTYQLIFDRFSTEANYDFVHLYQGDTKIWEKSGSYSGEVLSPELQGGHNYRLVFTSDHSVTGDGVRLKEVIELP